MKCIVVLYVTKRGFDMSDEPLIRFLVQGIFCTPSMLKNHCKYSFFENSYGVYKFKQLYTRRGAVNNILCENGIEFVVNKTSTVVCSKVCASHPFCVSFTYTINGDCHLFNKVLLDTTSYETSQGSSYYAEKDGLLESTTDFMTLFEDITANVVICDAGWVKLGNACYKFTPDGPKHWTTAKTFCNSIGGYLAIIETSEEDELLKSYVANIVVPSKDYWIGGSDLATEGVFIWENTNVNLPTSTLFQGWLLNQPDNNDGNQHCMMLAHQFDFKWNDATCDHPRDYIEVPTSESSDDSNDDSEDDDQQLVVHKEPEQITAISEQTNKKDKKTNGKKSNKNKSNKQNLPKSASGPLDHYMNFKDPKTPSQSTGKRQATTPTDELHKRVVEPTKQKTNP
ncbi:unnamed protein product [Mytilus edulis]|uniref:C-type lectin domain-containing protein n=1 Tax=Mytilus edulis TaxID=6550 RepID=A0A8S3TC73_MYTED|nr:unnamed protein product [Mytilus edulis]